MQTVKDHPVIRETEIFGMPEPEIVGECEKCGREINASFVYCKRGDELFCDETCFCEYEGLEVVG